MKPLFQDMLRPYIRTAIIAVLAAVAMAGPVAAQADYVLKLDTVSSQPGTIVDFYVGLENAGEVSGFSLLIGYDPTALWPQSITLDGTRASGFEDFGFTVDAGGAPGNIRIEATADLPGGGPTQALGAGEGVIVHIRFAIVNDIQFAGMWVPVWFEFSDPLTQDDNTLLDAEGGKIEQTEIDYYDGWVNIIEMGEVLPGDINLNGFAYEVSDYVYLTNYFMMPGVYVLDALQLANSDMNQDNTPATIADLVYLINQIVSGAKLNVAKGDPSLPAVVHLDAGPGQSTISYNAEFRVGGVLLVLRVADDFDESDLILRQQQMSMATERHGNRVHAFVHSRNGRVLPSGHWPLLTIPAGNVVELARVDLAAADGRTARVVHNGGRALPEGFELKQNYPNPFNPTTTIEFSLARPGRVSLTVYDLLGREMAVLIDDHLDAGSHRAVFDAAMIGGETVASGVYFYRLQTDRATVARKMMLLK
jgi:hypothetical protein